MLESFDKPDKAIYNSKEFLYRKNNFSLEFSKNKVGKRRPRVAWGNHQGNLFLIQINGKFLVVQ